MTTCRFLKTGCLTVAAALMAQTASAQVVIQQSSDVVQQQEGEGQPKQAIVMSATASPDGGPAVVQSFGVFSSEDGSAYEMTMPAFAPMVNTGDLNGLLSLPNVREELEMVDGQFEELQAAQREMSQELSKQLNEMMKDGKFDPGRGSGLKDLLLDRQKSMEAQIQQMLAPHQLERLKQIALHIQMKQNGAIGMLANKKVQEALDIDDEQMERLKEKSAELKKEMEEKIEKLKKQAQEELLKELSGKQRRKLEELMGDEFEHKPIRFQDRIRQRAGRASQTTESQQEDGDK